MLKFQNKIPSALTIGGKVVDKVRMMNEIVWQRSSEPVDVDYFYIENLYAGENTLTLTSTISGSPSAELYSSSVEFSKDKSTWTTINFDTSTPATITMNAGEKVYFRNDNGTFNYLFSSSNRFYTCFRTNQDCGAGGDLRSLLNYKNIKNVVLTQGCFYNLFYHCTKLTTPPELPATTLAPYCYQSLFSYCYSLTKAPELPATTLAPYCYQDLFNSCEKLTTAPELPATTLAPYCYSYLFSGCTRLTIPPALPATTLARGCYNSLFSNCADLTTAPELPATTLAPYCYNGLFYYCTSLTKAPELPATTLEEGCYNNLFKYCTKLSEVKTYADDISAVDCTKDWLYSVARTGTLYNYGSATYTTDSTSGIPSGWVEVRP